VKPKNIAPILGGGLLVPNFPEMGTSASNDATANQAAPSQARLPQVNPHFIFTLLALLSYLLVASCEPELERYDKVPHLEFSHSPRSDLWRGGSSD
jgi:hypothetical protein